MTSFYLVDLEQEKKYKGRREEGGGSITGISGIFRASESLEPHLRQPAYLGQINCFRNPELTESGPRPR